MEDAARSDFTEPTSDFFEHTNELDLGPPTDKHFESFLNDVRHGGLQFIELEQQKGESLKEKDEGTNTLCKNTYMTLNTFAHMNDLSPKTSMLTDTYATTSAIVGDTVSMAQKHLPDQKSLTQSVSLAVQFLSNLCALNPETLMMTGKAITDTVVNAPSVIGNFAQELTNACRWQTLSSAFNKKERLPEWVMFLLCSPNIKQALSEDKPGVVLQVMGKMMTYIMGMPSEHNISSVEGLGKLLASKIIKQIPSVDETLATEVCSHCIRGLLQAIHENCELKEYDDKKSFAQKLAKIVYDATNFDPMAANNDNMGKIIEDTMDFCKEYGFLDKLLGNQSGQMAELICQIWAANAGKTAPMGFDKKAVVSLQGMLTQLFNMIANDQDKVGEDTEVDENTKVYENTKALVAVIMNMITMDRLDARKPTVVDVVKKLLKIPEDSKTVRKKWSGLVKSGQEADMRLTLADEGKGIEGFLNGFTTQLFRKNGLVLQMQNQIEVLTDRLLAMSDDPFKFTDGGSQLASIKKELEDFLLSKIRKHQDIIDKIQSQDEMIQAQEKQQLLLRAETCHNLKKENPSKAESMKQHAEAFANARDLKGYFETCMQKLENEQNLDEDKRELSKVLEDLDLEKVLSAAQEKSRWLVREWNEKIQDVVKGGKGAEIFKKLDILGENVWSDEQKEKLSTIIQSANIDNGNDLYMLSDPEVQKKLLESQLVDDGTSRGKKQSEDKKEQALNKVKEYVEGKDNWCVRMVISLLCGNWLPKSLGIVKKGGMHVLEWGLKIHIAVHPRDESDRMKILKCIDLLAHDAPGFWDELTQNHGNDLHKLLNLVLSQNHGEYLFTQQEQVEKALKPLLQHTVTNLIGEPKCYKSIQCLLSIWTAPGEFDRLYKEVRQRQQQESKMNTITRAALSFAKFVGKKNGQSSLELRDTFTSFPDDAKGSKGSGRT